MAAPFWRWGGFQKMAYVWLFFMIVPPWYVMLAVVWLGLASEPLTGR